MMGRIVLAAAAALGMSMAASADDPPGVIVDRSPNFAKVYVGCPSIAILPDGRYVASHSWFGPGTSNDSSVVFRSTDRGATWRKLADLKGQWWSSLFVHRGDLHIFGVDREFGRIAIRRSRDGGATWTEPRDAASGRLTAEDRYHCAPVPVIVHRGRIWRGFELAQGPRPEWSAFVMSAPEDADLLHSGNWRSSARLQHLWSKSQWIEGNMVVAPDGSLLNILRTNGTAPPDHATIVHVSDDGLRLDHDRAADLIAFPGGGSKFTIRFDPETKRYWSIGNKQADPPAGRNVLALTSSPDLRTWTVHTIVLRHADRRFHAWQYVDWVFDGDDLAAVSRTAWDGSHNYHDANYLTFHRIANFRARTMADSAPVIFETVRCETADLSVVGHGFEEAVFNEGAQAFSNRRYVWTNVPSAFRGMRCLRAGGGEEAVVRVTARRDTVLRAATWAGGKGIDLTGWRAVPDSRFHYTDTNRAAMEVFERPLASGAEIELPRGNWPGMILLLPPESGPAGQRKTP